jgi:hypothetical protein
VTPEDAIRQALLWLGIDVCPHLFSRTMLDGHLTLVDFVFDKEILNFDVFCSFRAARLAVRLEQHRTHVVLIDERCFHIKALLLHKITCPKNISQRVVNPNKLSLGGTLCVDLLFPGIAHDHSLS